MMKTGLIATTVTLAAVFFSPLSLAAQDGGTVKARMGVAVSPAYEGASQYAAEPVYDLAGEYRTTQWGTFSLGVIHGGRWQLPLSGPVGVALLMGYDRGRDERIRTLGGDNTHLMGMGDLGGSLEGGAELSYQFSAFRGYIKGMQAARSRQYGGDALGHTAHVDMGVDGHYPLSEQLTLSGNLFTTWANSGYMQGYFGVTQPQSERTGFASYAPGEGMKQVTMETALNYQWTSAVALQTGVELSRLTGDAKDSPLVDNALAGLVFVSASYTF